MPGAQFTTVKRNIAQVIAGILLRVQKATYFFLLFIKKAQILAAIYFLISFLKIFRPDYHTLIILQIFFRENHFPKKAAPRAEPRNQRFSRAVRIIVQAAARAA
jgi:hypothetical protein